MHTQQRGTDSLLRELVSLSTDESTAERKARLLKDALWTLRTGRCYYLRELAAVEELRGNHLHGAVYRLRAVRFAGHDPYGDVDRVAALLRCLGRRQDAMAIEALYGPEPDARHAARATYFSEHRARCAAPPSGDIEKQADSRRKDRYRVGIIVSLYNAADKLPRLLRHLTDQTLFPRGDLEIVLVDSHSPSDEFGIAQSTINRTPHIAYVRTSRRETIQMAWNRGIALSRADYLSFIGADEYIVPVCSEKLASVLDAQPHTDWVMGNTKVADVDASGNHLRDIMPYDRTGANRFSIMQEICYINYVGGMYRRNVHDRVGYYDPTFRVAGDTEFKMRSLHAIEPAWIPDHLGAQNNYPEDRMSFLPHAEIEDHRAWWLMREGAVLAAALVDESSKSRIASAAAAHDLVRQALRFRRSFCGHMSCDVQFAGDIARVLRYRFEDDTELRKLESVCRSALMHLRAADRTSYRLYYNSIDPVDLQSTAISMARAAAESVSRAAGITVQYEYDERAEKLLQLWDS